MADRFHVLLPTDAFPPVAGGSGWSAHALAAALQDRGHRVTAIVPRSGGQGIERRIERGVPVIEVGYSAPRIPFVQNWFRFERLWSQLSDVIISEARREHELPVVIHGQHAQTIPASVLAGRALDVPVIATIRDAWPWHYFATGLLADRVPFRFTSAWIDWLDLIGRLGPLKGVLAAPAIIYMRRHLHRRAALLAEANAVIACSHYIRRKLEPIVSAERLHTIPHLVDIDATIAATTAAPPVDRQRPFLLFVGKLERNKGAHLLPAALVAARNAGADLPRLVIAGNGALENDLHRAFSVHDIDYEIIGGWIDHDQVLQLQRQAEILLFPSAWGEPLSRVLLEGVAVGACITAIDTGGTSDLIEDGISGVLVRDEIALGHAIATLLRDPDLRSRLRSGAQRIARERFAAPIVVTQVENVYQTANRAQRHA